ncbi:MAG: exodeoxyribonuclease VII large subunit [Gemmatimonadaceae bacterium]|nr:exodeoxyribonuclease VII large subunit [Gemmatimonadaceae bacterium]MCW5825347.1 exodeoxyribonuclease VII large subunit [Gemmatimonadaceae bacterium]
MTHPGATAAEALSVLELTSAAKDLIEGGFPRLWIRGEVSGFKSYSSGHWYFTLKDADASVSAVVWKGASYKIPAKPRDGDQVTAFGQLTVYPARGAMQFVVSQMLADGEGLWQRQFDETKKKLEAEGLLDPARKRALPRMPRTVAVITSSEGAALRDVISVIGRRHPGVHVTVIPALVQGEGSVESIVAALERLGRWVASNQAVDGIPVPDVVIVGRGGGSREDLWSFNDERVARAIAACPIPTISAVGHETDLSIADLVADLRAATPSVAAEHAVPLLAELRDLVQQLAGMMADGLQDRVEVGRRELQRCGEGLAQRAQLVSERRRARTERIAQRLAQAAPRAVERRRAALARLGAGLEARSPLAVFQRGFAVARDDSGATLATRAAFVPGRAFELLVQDGRIRATTDAVHADAPHLRTDP